jgi:hypothetical protein
MKVEWTWKTLTEFLREEEGVQTNADLAVEIWTPSEIRDHQTTCRCKPCQKWHKDVAQYLARLRAA